MLVFVKHSIVVALAFMHVNGFVNVLFKWCNHLEIVNLDQEENKDHSEQLHAWQWFLQDDCVFSNQPHYFKP